MQRAVKGFLLVDLDDELGLNERLKYYELRATKREQQNYQKKAVKRWILRKTTSSAISATV
jgi:hypothetical protein